jgi:hypothetical protein
VRAATTASPVDLVVVEPADIPAAGTSTLPSRSSKDNVMNAPLNLLAYLEAGIPVTLLVDLASPEGPDSPAIYAAEERERTAAA